MTTEVDVFIHFEKAYVINYESKKKLWKTAAFSLPPLGNSLLLDSALCFFRLTSFSSEGFNGDVSNNVEILGPEMLKY